MMFITTKEPVLAIVELLSDLSDTIPIYKETMSEDEDSIPNSYILIRTQISDLPRVYGDGTARFRVADCDVILVSKGVATLTTDIHNVNKGLIKSLLDECGITYEFYNLGYDLNNKVTQSTFNFKVMYG